MQDHSERLAALEVRVEEHYRTMNEKLDEICEDLHGNGRAGVKDRLSHLEHKFERLAWFGTIILFVFNALTGDGLISAKGLLSWLQNK